MNATTQSSVSQKARAIFVALCFSISGRNALADTPKPALDTAGDGVKIISAANGRGQWVEVRSAAPFAEHEFEIGKLPDMEKFTADYRAESSCWMQPAVGESLAAVPRETQFLLAQRKDGQYLALIPVLDGAFRCSLRGGTNGVLLLDVESGDSATQTNRVTGLYLETGSDPFALVRSAAASVRARLHPGEAAGAPRLPDFAQYLGWCTWNAFYTKISHENILKKMAEFTAGGVTPGMVVIDDGWFQATNKTLAGYDADPAKFPGGLAATIAALKQTNGVKHVLLWQAYNGYWRGTDAAATPAAGVRLVQPKFPAWSLGDGAKSPPKFYPKDYRQPVAEPDLEKFYSTFHRHLRSLGVDGVKIDAMTWVETLGEGRGGRVRAMRELVDAVGRSEREVFSGNVIWCSSCSSDCILQAPRAAVMRSSADFFPDKPESHGRHIAANAHASLWMGEFVVPDWDMFQSGHKAGAFHAAARAISGGPVYVSDEVGKTDFALLRKLTLSDGSVPLCLEPARPAADSLFLDPAREGRLFKIFNRNPAGGSVLGVFNCCYQPDVSLPILGGVNLADVPGVTDDVVVYQYQSKSLHRMQHNVTVSLSLAPLEFELLTFAPVENGLAVIGLTDKFNSGGCVVARRIGSDGGVEVDLRDGGDFLAWAERAPKSVTMKGAALPFKFDVRKHALQVPVPRSGPVTLEIH